MPSPIEQIRLLRKGKYVKLKKNSKTDIQIWMDQVKVCISLLIFCSTRGTNYNHSGEMTPKMFGIENYSKIQQSRMAADEMLFKVNLDLFFK